MSTVDDLFVNEDVSKPENRVNLALFSLMQQDWFREWILKRLSLPADAVVYPPTNVGSRRPDLKVMCDGAELSMIEVELGANFGQAEDYRGKFHKLKTIWGRKKGGGDLSLEEVAKFLNERDAFRRRLGSTFGCESGACWQGGGPGGRVGLGARRGRRRRAGAIRGVLDSGPTQRIALRAA